MADEVVSAAMTGYFRVELVVQGKPTKLWQAVTDGEVVGYFDARAAPFPLPELYEMRVIDGQMAATMKIDQQTGI